MPHQIQYNMLNTSIKHALLQLVLEIKCFAASRFFIFQIQASMVESKISLRFYSPSPRFDARIPSSQSINPPDPRFSTPFTTSPIQPHFQSSFLFHFLFLSKSLQFLWKSRISFLFSQTFQPDFLL